MVITQIVVGIHEKRNHPYAYGHYDASVTLTASLDDRDSPHGAIALLRAQARRHVFGECDDWEEAVHEEHRIAKLVGSFEDQVRHLDWDTVNKIERCNKIIAELPEDMRKEYCDRLIEAVNRLPPKAEATEDENPEDYYEGEEELEF